nr:MAG TPA: hypothetical protein [Caudoviricetes sp.]DAT37851.1 MAG TPA: hypothetical protein [Caudoviricetes sp.]
MQLLNSIALDYFHFGNCSAPCRSQQQRRGNSLAVYFNRVDFDPFRKD